MKATTTPTDSIGIIWFGTEIRSESGASVNKADFGTGISVQGARAAPALWNQLVVHCRNGELSSMKHILDDDSTSQYISIDACDLAGQTLLHFAVAHDRLEIVQWLIEEKGANICGFSNERLIMKGGDTLVQEALKNKSSDNPMDSTVPLRLLQTSGWTPLHLAASKGFLSIVQYLVRRNAPMTPLTKRNETPLLLAIRSRQREAAVLLQQSGGDPQQCDIDGATPLHYAASRGYRELVYLLLNNQHDCFALDMQGRVPLHYAALHNHADTCELLAERMNAVFKADRKRYPSTYQYGRIRDKHGQTPENFATQQGNSDLAKFLRTYRDNQLLRSYQLLTVNKTYYFQSFWFISLLVIHSFGLIYVLGPLAESFTTFLISSSLFICFGFNIQTHLTDPGYARSLHKKLTLPTIQNPVKCKGCQISKPTRSRHCIVCDECVVKFDHHCILVNACIGGGNHHYFYAFVITQLIYAVHGTYLCYRVLFEPSFQSYAHSEYRHILVSLFIIGVCGTLLALLFFIPHTIVMLSNVTTYERAHARRAKAHIGGYSKGGWRNTLEFWHISGNDCAFYAQQLTPVRTNQTDGAMV